MLRWQTFGGLTNTDHRRTLLRPTEPDTNEMDGSCTPKARYRDVIAPATTLDPRAAWDSILRDAHNRGDGARCC